MRNAILQLPDQRTTSEQRKVLRAAIRRLPVESRNRIQGNRGQGLDRAEIYLAAAAYMQLDDRAAQRSVRQLRADVEGLKRHLSELRAGSGS